MSKNMENGFRINREYILMLVQRKGWTKRKFSILLNIDDDSLYRWINGERNDTVVLMKAVVKLFSDEPLDKLFLRD